MSKTGAIFIKSNHIDFKAFENIIKELSDEGWSINKKGNLFFMINDSYEWQAAPFDDYETVISLIKTSINNNLATCIDLTWEDETASIGFNFLNDKTIMISISEEIKMLGSLPVIDFSWYLEKISILFKSIEVNKIECSYE